MQKLLKDYLDELNKKQKRRRKSAIALTLVAVMLISTVAWNLAEYGIAMTGDPKCGLEEHQHSEACYEDVLICGQEESAGHTHTDACRKTEQQLVCGQEESAGHTHTDACFQTEQQLVCGQEESAEHTHTEACYTTVQTQICGQEESAGHTHSESCYTTVETYTCGQEESAGHTHTEACYEKQLVCGKEEHTHSDACFIDPKADVEDASVWNTQYANIQWKDAWGEDLVTAAEKQIGYKESVDNYTVTENEDHKGYTRYGQFAGDVYADWDAAFVNFCMYYAGLEATNLFPKETETAKWYDKFAQGVNRDYLTAPAEYEPQVGDLVFFRRENEETENQMGIVSSYNKETNEIQVIEGNVDNAVKENKYAANDVHITAYLKISELEAAYKNDGAEASEEETPEEAAPAAEELNYEDDQITVKVTASEVGIIPEGASLKVVPITKENAETEAQYQNVEAKLQEKAENEEYDIAGFLAYDISFVDAAGNKLEPNGKVNVSMDYKSPELPQEVVENGAADAEVTVLHLEEDENGEVKQIVDMGAEQKATVDTLATTEGEKVQSVELETESFSVFVLTWKDINRNLNINLIDEAGNDICPDDLRYEISQETTVQEIADQIASQLPGYTFKRAVRAVDNLSAIIESTEITKLQYNASEKRWEGYNGKKWKKINNKDDKLFFIYEATDPGTGGGDGGGSDGGMTTLGTPEHNKYIEKISDEDYKLSLDVTGKVGEEIPIDILLIVDKSGSMKDEAGEKKRYENVNAAIDELKKQLNSSTTQINMSVVTFSAKYPGDFTGSGNDKYYKDDTYADAWKTLGWTSLNRFSYSLRENDCDGGTNWQAGIRKGEEVLKERANVTSRKYVLFLTDGLPTFRLYNESDTITQGAGNSDSGNKNYNAAVTEWQKSTNLSSINTKKYVIDASGDSTTNTTCNNFASAIKATCLQGNNGTELQEKFKQIASDILKPVYKNVTIEDTLSAYVDLLEEPQFEVVKVIDGVSTPVDATQVKREQVKITLPDGTEKDSTKISILLENGGQLKDGAKYTLSFHVKPSEYAESIYQENRGYLHTGDQNTDAPGKSESEYTSSGKEGFYSNDSAILKYSENDGVEQPADYQKPVVQVKEPPIVPPEEDIPENVPHHKYIDYLGDDGENTQTSLSGQEYYRLYLDVKGIPNTEPEPADIVLVLDYSSSMTTEFSGLTRWDYVKKSATLAVNTLLPDNISTKNRIAIVWFDRRANESHNVAFTNSKNQLLSNIQNMNTDKGTNYQAAFWNAQDMLENSDGHKKFVVFVTDGEPWHYYTNGKNNQIDSCLDYSGNTVKAADAGEAAVKGFNYYGLNGFYAVSVGKDTGKTFLQNRIVGNVNASVKSVIEATNEAELTNAFSMVLGSITKQIGNVTITDKLSPYVNFVDEAGEVLGKYDTDQDGIISGTKGDTLASKLGLKVNFYDYDDSYNNHSKIVEAPEYTGNYTYKIKLNDKVISVNFGADYFLERDKVYTISFNVALTDQAFEDSMSHTGDLNTDYPGNITSSGKLGFYSNNEATLSYERVKNGAIKKETVTDYEKPVVQPYEKGEWKIKKVNEGSTRNLPDAVFTLSKDGEVVYTGRSGEDGIVNWSDKNNNRLTSSNDIEKGTYILEETVAPVGYVLSVKEWTVEIQAKGAKPIVKDSDDTEVSLDQENNVYILKIENEVLYSLPSTGGSGIYWYIFSGVLLMAAAMLIIYKNKCKEVLKS